MTPKEFLIERAGPFAVFPVIHHSYEFAVASAEVFHVLKPCAVAVEYPKLFQQVILQGIARLPRISILMYGRNFIRIEPVDPFVEAARLAMEHHLELQCVDLAIPDYPEVNDPLPDPYSMNTLGHRKYCEMLLESLYRTRMEEDEQRECAMAFYMHEFADQLQASGKLPSQFPVLMLCGLAHFRGVLEQYQRKHAQPFQPSAKGKLYHLSSQSLGEIMGVFPFLTAVYESHRKNAPEVEVHEQEQQPVRKGRIADQSLQILSGKEKESLAEFTKRAQRQTALDSKHDRNEIAMHFLFWCRDYYEQEIGDRIHPQSLKLLHDFSRKYANVKNMLLPDFYEVLVAARNCVSSHFCYRVWEIGTAYEPQQGATELEVIELRASDIFPLVQKVRMNPNAPLRPRSALPRFLRRSEKQHQPKKDFRFQPFSICSYQPEDFIIEDYGRYLKSKGKSMLSEDRKRVRPFETSLLDGIDLRETIRNWHSGTIYVQEFLTVKGSVDSLVVIYDEEDEKYPYTMTWMGEHYQESDMAFYATDPEERQIGPGIRKAIYGGFLMTMPPGRLFDVFHDPAYQFAESYAERLLLAGIDYGLERFVLYAAPKPPRPMFQVIAGRYGKRILYIPLAQLSPVQLRKVRSFHVLADKQVRDYAKDYIW